MDLTRPVQLFVPNQGDRHRSLLPTAPTPTLPGDIIITEIMSNPISVSDIAGEWFELHNPTNTDFDLNGLIVVDNGNDSFTIDTSLILQAQGYVVLGINSNSNTNGFVTVDFQYENFSLSNSLDTILILNGTTVLDETTYTSTIAGVTASLDPGAFDAVANDNPLNWCAAVDLIAPGADLGTPGALNPDCQL